MLPLPKHTSVQFAVIADGVYYMLANEVFTSEPVLVSVNLTTPYNFSMVEINQTDPILNCFDLIYNNETEKTYGLCNNFESVGYFLVEIDLSTLELTPLGSEPFIPPTFVWNSWTIDRKRGITYATALQLANDTQTNWLIKGSLATGERVAELEISPPPSYNIWTTNLPWL
eukprot:TRINITY_DN4380_c0_g1_i1.p1 TRINITY_DN4380_c0_g1~~TRINITY_DN4380_c0_g1_i1.p1  ORF type:complete len:171 (-),score=19.14 TRINITY_DN4380_c0_g1_i1:86-598(-)